MSNPVEVAQVTVLSQHLMASHGPTVGYPELAEILGTTEAALRVRKTRRDDLPRPIAGLADRRWPTPVIAAWLLRGDGPDSEVPERRRGRPRLGQRAGF